MLRLKSTHVRKRAPVNFTSVPQDCFFFTVKIVWLTLCQWNNLKWYGKVDRMYPLGTIRAYFMVYLALITLYATLTITCMALHLSNKQTSTRSISASCLPLPIMFLSSWIWQRLHKPGSVSIYIYIYIYVVIEESFAWCKIENHFG